MHKWKETVIVRFGLITAPHLGLGASLMCRLHVENFCANVSVMSMLGKGDS